MTSAKRRTWLDGPVAGGLSLFVSPIPSEFAEPSSCIQNITEPYWFLQCAKHAARGSLRSEH